MIQMNTRKLTQISLMTLLVGGLGACSQAGHGKHSARYGSGEHVAGHYGGHQQAAGWESHGGWETSSAWETSGGAGQIGGAYGGTNPQPQTPAATYTGGAVIIPGAPQQAHYAGGATGVHAGGYGYGGAHMPAPAPTPVLRSRYGTVTAGNGDTCCIVPQIVYVDRIQTVEVEKIVEKPVEKIVEVERIVEKIVEVEKPVYIEVPGYQPPPVTVHPRPKSRK